MASSASIGGLSSGLDTATIIDQLMKLEAVPQTRLKSRVTSEQSLVTTLQTLNTKTALLASKAAQLAKPATWTVSTSSSSSSAVGVTTTAAAQPGQLTVAVTSIARSHQLGFAQASAMTDVVTGASTTISIDRYDGTRVQLETGDGTLKGLITAINDATNQTGLRATPVRTADGYRLLVESVATGAASDFTLTQADGSALLGGATVRAGADASIDLGSGITVTSTSNTFSDLVPGVSLTLGSDATVGTTSTIVVKRDSSKLGAAVTDLVAAMNTLLTEIDSQTAYDTSSGKSGALAGDAAVRNLRTAVLGTVFSADSTVSLAKLGIQTDRSGKVSFDGSKFAAAFAADPEGTAAMFTTATAPAVGGFAARLDAVARGASDPDSGSITAAITGRRSGIERLQDGIDSWDLRLTLRRESLNRQFTALETAMNTMSSQSSWLSGQISSLPSYS